MPDDSDSFECEYCGKTFPEENAMLQHQRAVHPEEVPDDAGSIFDGEYTMHWTILGGLLLVLAGVGFYFYGPLKSWWGTPEYPTVYDHWHATYKIKLCGETLPPAPRKKGDIHTHGHGRIHIHPHTKEGAGKAANLGNFMASFGGLLTDTKLGVPMRGTYTNGDECPGGEQGKVQVIVNGEKVADPDGYVPKDGDNVIIKFAPPSG